MRPPQGQLDAGLSQRIAGARLLCIVGMIYVHVPGLHDMAGGAGPFSAPHLLLPTFLVDGFGRASAALLSVVSGWLCARALLDRSRSPLDLVVARARSTLVPMVLWALATVAVYAVVSLVRPTFLLEPVESLVERVLLVVNAVVFIVEPAPGPTLHLAFLRDLFVCVVLAAPLLALLRRWPVITLATLGLAYLWQAEVIIVLRPLVPFAFAIGLALRLYERPLDALDRFWPVWIVCAVAATFAVMASGLNERPTGSVPPWRLDIGESVLYPLSRLSWALLLWAATARLVGSALARWAKRHLAWIFIAFCSHFLLLSIAWAAVVAPGVSLLSESLRGPAFLVWFVIAPALAFALARAGMGLLATAAPALARAAGVPARYAWARRPAVGSLPFPDSDGAAGVPGAVSGPSLTRSVARAAEPRHADVPSYQRRAHVTERTDVRIKPVAG